MITKNKMTTNYTVEIDKTKYYFEDLELKENAIGKMSLPYQTIDKIYLSVAADILSDREKELSYAELAFVAKRIPLSMSEIANLIKKNKSTISKWKEKDNIPYDTSFVIKQKLSEIIFEESESRENKKLDKLKFWTTNHKLPKATTIKDAS